VAGDTLYSIARKYNTSVNELIRINNLSSNVLSIGQRLIIPKQNNTYTVVSGDTLYSIARKYNTTVSAIKKINNLTSDLLNIGQVLIIPT
jgi:LysM repeat protein